MDGHAATVVSGAVLGGKQVDLSQSPEVSGTQEGRYYAEEQERMPLNYVNQPPMIPQRRGAAVTTNTNRCLQCHGVESYRTTGAPRISPTHLLMDSDGEVSGNVAPRRYFYLQCHVPQSRYRADYRQYLYPSWSYGK